METNLVTYQEYKIYMQVQISMIIITKEANLFEVK